MMFIGVFVVETGTEKNPCGSSDNKEYTCKQSAKDHPRIVDTFKKSFGTFRKWLGLEDISAPDPSSPFCQKITDNHALNVLALHGVVPLLAVCLYSSSQRRMPLP